MRVLPIRGLVGVLLTTTGFFWSSMAPATVMTLFDPDLVAMGAPQDGANITRDLDNQLDWLDWNLTTSYSYDMAQSELLAAGGALAGWRFASEADFLALGVSAGVADIYIDKFVAGPAPGSLQGLAAALGFTDSASGSAFGVFGEMGTQPGTLRLGGITLRTMVGGDRGRAGPTAIFDAPNDPEYWMAQNWSSYKVNSRVGMALVRSSLPIPEPGIAALFIGGFLSLFVVARTRRESTPS